MKYAEEKKQMIKCNLCGQKFDPKDDLIDHRKERHQEIHLDKGASRNKIVGKVEWRKSFNTNNSSDQVMEK